MKYFRVKVKLKTGFEYSYTCIERMLEGMKKSSEGYWTESVVSEEITEEDFRKTREVSFEEDKVLRKAIVKSAKVVDKGKLVEKKGIPQMASLENFFEDKDYEVGTLEEQEKFEKKRGGVLGKKSKSTGGAPENKKLKKRV